LLKRRIAIKMGLFHQIKEIRKTRMAPIKKNDDLNNKSNYQPIQRIFSPTKKPLKVENKKTKIRNQNST
jgi:hypothetical protein